MSLLTPYPQFRLRTSSRLSLMMFSIMTEIPEERTNHIAGIFEKQSQSFSWAGSFRSGDAISVHIASLTNSGPELFRVRISHDKQVDVLGIPEELTIFYNPISFVETDKSSRSAMCSPLI